VQRTSGTHLGSLVNSNNIISPTDSVQEDFKVRAESQKELNNLLDACFKKKTTLNNDDFAFVIENIDSGMYLCILSLLRTHFPSLDQFKRYEHAKKKSAKTLIRSASIGKKMASPRIMSKFSSTGEIARSSTPKLSRFRSDSSNSSHSDEDSKENTQDSKKSAPKSKFAKQPGDFTTAAEMQEDLKNPSSLSAIRLANAKLDTKDVTNSPSVYLGHTKETESEQLLFCQCGRQITNFDILQCDACAKKEANIKVEGALCSKCKKTGKIKKYWYIAENQEFYSYAIQTDKTYRKMKSLKGCFIKEGSAEKIDDKTIMYSFSIHFTNSKKKKYFTQTADEQVKWCKTIKTMMGYSSLADFYELRESLGQGKFGIVKSAIHKKTGKKVAVKMLKKASMSVKDLEFVRNEIETLKMCQHPNIIKLLDLFENIEHIYIVMEFLDGGDLFYFLEKRKFKIPEERARKITHSLAAALYYLHSYGIVHRDIKPENIMMENQTDTADVKIVDFGLAKMIGPSQFCGDLYGTLGYVAPEVLKQEPYGKPADIWSLGIIAHLLMVGFLPFDHDNDITLAK